MSVTLKACRLCGNRNLDVVIDLGSQALAGTFPSQYERVPSWPLKVVKCMSVDGADVCGLVQLDSHPPLHQMYGMGYGYRSGLNAGMVRHLQATAERLTAIVPQGAVLDVGANDGTLLRALPHKVKVGIDPTARKFAGYYDEASVAVPEFFSPGAVRGLLPGGKADIVTSIACLYDMEDPGKFADDVASLLSPGGVWYSEQSYLPAMLRQGSYDSVCNEHIEYYALRQVERMLARPGLCLLDVWETPTNGGSFAFVAGWPAVRPPAADRIAAFEQREQAASLWRPSTYSEFAAAAQRHAKRLRSDLFAMRKLGWRIMGLGACYDEGTRAVTRSGFKHYSELKVGEEVLTLNPTTREVEYQAIQEIMTYPYDGELIRFKGRRVDLAVTPNHRMLLDTKNRSRTLVFEPAAKAVARVAVWLPVGGWSGRHEEDIDIRRWVNQDEYRLRARRIPNTFRTADFLYLLGLYIGDGYVCTRDQGFSVNLCIPQGDKARQSLENVLHRMGLRYRSYKPEVQVASKALVSIFKECGEDALTKRIPGWALEYSQPLLRELMRGLVDSDGWYEPSGTGGRKTTRRRYRTSSPGLAKDMIELCVKLSISPSISISEAGTMDFRDGRPLRQARESYTINLATTQPECHGRGTVAYRGIVWCVSVANKNLLVERNGRIAFCGNSTKGNVLLQYAGIGPELVEAIADVNDDKWGKVTPGTGIPIVCEAEARDRRPSVFLVLPWHFKAGIVERERAFLDGGGKLLFPLPEMVMVDRDGEWPWGPCVGQYDPARRTWGWVK